MLAADNSFMHIIEAWVVLITSPIWAVSLIAWFYLTAYGELRMSWASVDKWRNRLLVVMLATSVIQLPTYIVCRYFL